MKRLVFGTMRMHEWQRSRGEWLTFFGRLRDAGIHTLHTSHEYESYALLCDVLGSAGGASMNSGFEYVVKLGEPSFDDSLFDAARLRTKVDAYLSRLGVERLEVVQWMWRSFLKEDAVRCQHFQQQAPEIAAAFRALAAEGKLKSWRCFPYTVPFALGISACEGVGGLAVYRNPWETEYDDLTVGQDPGYRILAIRPFAAGKGFQEGRTTASLLDYALSPPAVDMVVATATAPGHVDRLMAYARTLH